jgi:glutamate--cysteine ligase
MSTDLDWDPSGLSPIRAPEEVADWFAEGCTPRSRWGIGLEYERLGVFSHSGRAIPYSGQERSLKAVLEDLAREGGWTAHRENEHPIALFRDRTKITLEPGGQTELSSSIQPSLEGMRSELCGFVEQINRVSAPHGISWIGIGLQPFTLRDAIEWVPKFRYRIMSAALGRTGRLAHDMMKRTAGIQINLDYETEEDAAAKFRMLMGVAPVITALFANSPLSGGRPNGFMSERAAIWQETDPARCGLLPFAFEDRPLFAAYLEYALDVPMLFVVRNGHWHAVDVTFRRFIQNGYQGLTARVADWDLHLTTLFPEVRLKRHLEARFADSGDAALAMAQSAMIKGLVYDDAATADAWDLVREFTWEQRLALHREVCRHGLQTRVAGISVEEISAGLVQVARRGLARLAEHSGQDERHFLAPLDVILGDGESPARRLLRLWESGLGHTPQRLVSHLAQVNLDCYTC